MASVAFWPTTQPADRAPASSAASRRVAAGAVNEGERRRGRRRRDRVSAGAAFDLSEELRRRQLAIAQVGDQAQRMRDIGHLHV